MSQFCEQRWRTLMDSLSVNLDYQSKEYLKLESAYSEKHRAYHTAQHISECLEKLDWARSQGYGSNIRQIEMALWYHDAIYNPRSKNNERRSAELCRQFLLRAETDAEFTATVCDLIMFTEHTGNPNTLDGQLLVDIDLSILGADRTRFAEYEWQIRREYKWVPKFLYKNKRREIFQSFLQRPRIYFSEIFYEAFENRARMNILETIQKYA